MALGLVVALIGVLGVTPGVGPALAQESAPSEEDTPLESGAPVEKPSQSTPAMPPAFSPSGAGPGSGTGSETGIGSGSGSSAPASGPTESSQSGLPPLGAVTYENALQDERVFKAGYCFGRKAFSQYVGEGFKLRVMGPCHLLLDEAWIAVEANGVMVGDGEVAIDFKIVAGEPRSRLGIYVRGVNEQMIGAQIQPSRGEASLFTLNGGQQTDLAYRNNIPGYKSGDWNRLAIRVNGHNAWLLLNDEPLIHTNEVHADAGKVIIELLRDGSFEDEEESAVVFRDLTLTVLEGGEPGRAPTGP